MHNPGVFNKYNIIVNDNEIINNKIFIVVSFYMNITNMCNTIKDLLFKFLHKCKHRDYQNVIQSVFINIANTKVNSINNYLRK